MRKFQDPAIHEFLHHIPRLSEKTKRTNKLQQWGNKLRENDASFLAKQAIREIAKYRQDQGEPGDPLRVAHIIRSLKNDNELELLKKMYGDMFITVSVSGNAEEHLRNYFEIVPAGRERNQDEKNLRKRCEEEFDALTKIDQDEGLPHGQRVRKIFYKADLFLNNNHTSIADGIQRFLDLLFGRFIHNPNTEESMMFKAFGASLQSTCLSRQVGAALANKHGDLISIGWNDIPRYGGGLAQSSNQNESTASCKYKGYCNSQKEIDALIEKIINKLQDEEFLKEKNKAETKEKYDNMKKLFIKYGFSELTEFSRAVHAEMEAILHAARNGFGSLKDSTLYVTTYPCENCVKHILAAGITKVVYVEPYPKSRAIKFFADFIASEDENDSKKLRFEQFTGISPIIYSKFFRMSSERKTSSGTLRTIANNPMPLTNTYMDSFTLYESLIAKEMVLLDEKFAKQ